MNTEGRVQRTKQAVTTIATVCVCVFMCACWCIFCFDVGESLSFLRIQNIHALVYAHGTHKHTTKYTCTQIHTHIHTHAQSREDWKIVRALSEYLKHPLPYNTIEELRTRLTQVCPHFAHVGHVETPSFMYVCVCV